MLIDLINLQSKTNKVYVFFDMDGVMAEYKSGERKDLLSNAPNFFINKRPINTVISQIKKLGANKNIEICIMSACYFKQQRQDKITWLKKNAPFIKQENIHIVVYEEEVYNQENKYQLKAKKIESLMNNKNAIIYLIEDDQRIIKETIKYNQNIRAEHVSTILN